MFGLKCCCGNLNNRTACVTVLACLLLVYISYGFNACLMARVQRALAAIPSSSSSSQHAVLSNTHQPPPPPPPDDQPSHRPSADRHAAAAVDPPIVLKMFGSLVRVIPLTPYNASASASLSASSPAKRALAAAASGAHRSPNNKSVTSASAAAGKAAQYRPKHQRLPISLSPKVDDTSDDATPKYRLLRQPALHPDRHLPHALIIGVKKSGTRALLEFIRLHPDVRAAGCEVHFFDRHYAKGLSWYRTHMPPTIDGQLTMEKTPSYFVTRDVPARVHRMNAAVRLLVVVRDPVTRAISDYTQAASKKPDMRRFEDLAFPNGTTNGVDTNWGTVKIGVYARHLEWWLQYFPISQLLFVSGERLIVDPAFEMGRVQDFLGLKRVVTEKHFYFNATKGFPCLFKSEARSSPHCLGKTKGRNHPHIEPAAVQRLRDFYRPFNARFYRMTGIHFGWL